MGQGVQLDPLDAFPSYPGRQVHWVTEMLPSGEIELAGQAAGTNTGGAELVNPSTVALTFSMAACVVLVSLATTTTEKETESPVTCSRLRRPPRRSGTTAESDVKMMGDDLILPGKDENRFLNEREAQNTGNTATSSAAAATDCWRRRTACVSLIHTGLKTSLNTLSTTAAHSVQTTSTGMSTKRDEFVLHATRTEETAATDEITTTLSLTNSAERPEI
jgi:hypothetical protein